MLEKLKTFAKGSIVAFAVLGVVAIVTTAIKMRRDRAALEADAAAAAEAAPTAAADNAAE